MSKVRVAKMIVELVAYADDGEHLKLLKIQPLELEGTEIMKFLEGGFAESIANLEDQVNLAE